jgi:hypothetical protein
MRFGGLAIDTVVCLTLAKWETVSGQFGGYLTPHICEGTLGYVWKLRNGLDPSETYGLGVDCSSGLGDSGGSVLMERTYDGKLEYLKRFCHAAHPGARRFVAR